MTELVNKRLKIAHFGAFDHDSYGDLIFPLLVEHFLPEFDFIHVSPSGIPTPWPDAKKTISIAEAILIDDWDGVLVGGGDIVQSNEWTSQIWAQSSLLSFGALSSLWCGASLLSAKLNIPCVWNSPGVPFELPENITSLAVKAFRTIDYIAVRDSFSADKVNKLLDKPAQVIPDTALSVSELWPATSIENHLRTKPIVISLTPTDILQRWHEIEILFDSIKKRADFSGEVIFLPLMAWQGDDKFLRQQIKQRSDLTITIKDRSLSLKDCALTIANSLAYVGNSLHGLITAVSYGVPGVLVEPLGYKANNKYLGFMNHFGTASHMEASNFGVAADHFNHIPINSFKSASDRLCNHWSTVGDILKKKSFINKNKIWNDICNDCLQREKTMLMFGLSGEQLLSRGTLLKLENVKLNEHLEQLNQALIEREAKIASMSQATESTRWLVKKLAGLIVSFAIGPNNFQRLLKYLTQLRVIK